MPKIEGSGRWTEPRPMSVWPSRAHSAARAGVSVSRRWARARSPATSRARAVMVPVSARCPASVTRSRWRWSGRRGGGRRRDVGDGGILTKGVTHRTGEITTSPVSSARSSRAWPRRRQPGVPSGRRGGRPRSPARRAEAPAANRPAPRARSGRRVSRARPTSLSGPEQHRSRGSPSDRVAQRAMRARRTPGCRAHRRDGCR